ncbi:MAG: FKBP-type peptidyl-prolyl cis-trans isomerase [Actinomycetota bacterium]|nr:FKBP-type peptidyl-prolyl cis-trans isomerase [Actinomycetota bacterium]
MGTTKRERQKANRQLRLEELAKQARKQKTKRFGLRIFLIIASVVALVAVLYLVGGDDDSTTTAATTTTVPASTTTVDPIESPTKPEVALPAANPTELKVTTITEGAGPEAKNGDVLRVYYVGVLSADGTEFDTNYGTGKTLDLRLGAGMVIQGWEQGLVGVQVGGRYQIDIPADLAYGDVDTGGLIPPNSALTFVVDIMRITPDESAATTTSAADTSAPATT